MVGFEEIVDEKSEVDVCDGKNDEENVCNGRVEVVEEFVFKNRINLCYSLEMVWSLGWIRRGRIKLGLGVGDGE